MKKRLLKAIENTSELRALFVLCVLLALRAWRVIPNLRPNQLAIPAALSLIITLIIAASSPGRFIVIFPTGLFIVMAIFMFPMLQKPPRPTAHWLKDE